MRTKPIVSFTGEFFFLSNFYVNPFTWRNIVFPTGEHAFQYAKGWFAPGSQNVTEHQSRVLAAPTPAKAKYAGRSVVINVDEWDNHKVQIMREIVHARFQTSEQDMVGPLLNTGAAMLVEGNDWGDTFWGRCDGRGRNVLGSILMEERGYWLRGNLGVDGAGSL